MGVVLKVQQESSCGDGMFWNFSVAVYTQPIQVLK